MPVIKVGVLFELQRADTCPGDCICVVGDRPELGNWDQSCVGSLNLGLRTSTLMYPRWAMLRPIWLDVKSSPDDPKAGQPISYKYVIERRNQPPIWENSIRNRTIMLPPEDGSIWLIANELWDSSKAEATITRLTRSEVSARWTTFDPEWMVRPHLRSPMMPTNYLLTPRVDASPQPAFHNNSGPSTKQEGIVEEGAYTNDDSETDDDDHKYDIVQEFNALSPRLAISPRMNKGNSNKDLNRTINSLRAENTSLKLLLKKLTMSTRDLDSSPQLRTYSGPRVFDLTPKSIKMQQATTTPAMGRSSGACESRHLPIPSREIPRSKGLSSPVPRLNLRATFESVMDSTDKIRAGSPTWDPDAMTKANTRPVNSPAQSSFSYLAAEPHEEPQVGFYLGS